MVSTIITSTCLISLDSSSCYLKSSWESIYIYSLFIMDFPSFFLYIAFIDNHYQSCLLHRLAHTPRKQTLPTLNSCETQKWVRFVSSMMMQVFLEERQQQHLHHHFLAWQPYYRFDIIGENICVS